MINLEIYKYKYALVPYKEAKEKLGLGWRKVDPNGMALINYSDIKCLSDGERFEDVIESFGGRMLTPDEARYYRKTTVFAFSKVTVVSEDKYEEPNIQEPVIEPDEEIVQNEDSDQILKENTEEIMTEENINEEIINNE